MSASAPGEGRRVAGFDEPAGLARPHLVGQAAGARRDDRLAVRHRLERDERAALVERRVDEHVGGSYHACSSRSVDASGRGGRARSARPRRWRPRCGGDTARRRPAPSATRPPAARAASRASAAASTWKPLFSSRRPTLSSSRSPVASPSRARSVAAVRPRTAERDRRSRDRPRSARSCDPRRIDAEVRTHRRPRARSVAMTASARRAQRAPPTCSGGRRVASSCREAGIRAAELLESLRVEHERRADARTAGAASA